MKKIGVFLLLIGLGLTAFGVYKCFFEDVVYNVEFNTNGGSLVAKQLIHKGDTAIEPDKPTKEGYVFENWFLNNKLYDFSSKVTKDLILDAKWNEIQNVIVTFKYNDESKEIEFKKDTKVNKFPSFEIEDGYRIVWKNNDENVDFDTLIVDSDITLDGELVKLKSYVITFKSNGGSNVSNQTVYEGDKVSKPSDPTRTSYIFDGWYNGDSKYNFNDSVKEALTLEAKWEKDPNIKSFVVTFDTDGGNSIDSQYIEDGGKVKKPTNPTKDDYSFVEWQLDGKTYNFGNKVTEDITLTAIWSSGYIVKFNSTGGSAVANQKVKSGGVAKEPKVPTKKGYKFIEWQLDNTKYDFSSKVTKSITLNALWEKYCIVTFNTNGGSKMDVAYVENGSLLKEPTNPTKEGYTFVKWQLNGSDFDFNIRIESDITLVAVWE